MCGITGIINLNQNAVSEDQIRTMMSLMKHRGPDDEGTFMEDNTGLGFVRLSILDLSPAGHQPMFSQDGRYVIIFNGEVFNYLELKKDLEQLGHTFKTNTDTEVVLAAYIEWGENCLNRFNGMWGLAIYDREEKSIFITRDRYGIKPLYYLQTEDFFAFASEIPPLLSLLAEKPTPDNQSIFDYLVFNRTDQSERTFFSEVKKLQHGHKLTVNHFIGAPIKWYNLRERVAQTKGFTNPEDFKAVFNSAIGLRLRSDVPVGVCLSGGLDSSSIVSVLLNDFDKDDLNTFSAVYGNGKKGDEMKFIQEFGPMLKNMYFTTPDTETLANDIECFVKAHGEPIPSTGPYAQFKVMELAKDHVTVTIDGQGADEALAGYHYFYGFYFKDLLRKGKLGRLASEITHYYRIHKSFFGIKSMLFFLLPKSLRTRVRAMEKAYLDNDFYNIYASQANEVAGNLYGSPTLQEALINHFEYKLEHLLKWEDRNSMWHSMEARVPYLDYRLVEKMLSMASSQIIKKGVTKHILRESMQGILPEVIRQRQDKMGFDTPQDEWFRMPVFKDYITELINSESFASRGVIDVKKVKQIYQKHLDKQGNYAKEIWKWIHLENWYRQFID
jgi:asparagine synthase (glutamine-hydrolysing)